jgi:hypothetical protein
MIPISTNDKRVALHVFANTSNVTKQLFFDIIVNKWISALGAKCYVKVILG